MRVFREATDDSSLQDLGIKDVESIKRCASRTWKAIVAGREALETGMIDRIGDDTSVSFWDDRWISSYLSLKPTLHIGNAMLNFVSTLLILIICRGI